jgi:hypothetical protein
MNEAISFSLWALTFIFFGTYFVIGLSRYKAIHKKSYRLEQQLPIELHDAFYDQSHRYGVWRWLLFFGTLSLFAFWEGNFVYPSVLLTYILLGIMTIWLISFLSLFMIQVKRIEIYLLIVSLFFVTTVALLFLASYITLTSPFNQWQTFLPWTTLAQGVIQLAVLFNPKLKQWALLEKYGESNEKPLYRRPSHFVMAYTQWFTIINVLIWVILTQLEKLIG